MIDTCQGQGGRGGSETIYWYALEGPRKVFGQDHPTTLASLSNLVMVLAEQEKCDGSGTMNGRTRQRLPREPDQTGPQFIGGLPVALRFLGALGFGKGGCPASDPLYCSHIGYVIGYRNRSLASTVWGTLLIYPAQWGNVES